MDKVNLKWETNIYNISHMKFNASSHGKIPAPLAYKSKLKLCSEIKSCSEIKFSQNLFLTKHNIKLVETHSKVQMSYA